MARFFRILRSWFLPGGLVLAGLLVWVRFFPDPELFETLSAGYPLAVFGAGALLAWRFRRSRILAALILFAVVGWGLPTLAESHAYAAWGAAAYLVPLSMALLALLDDASVHSPRGLTQVLGALLAVAAGLVTVLFRPAGVVSLMRAEPLPPGLTAWTGLPQPVALAYGVAALVLIAALVRRSDPVEKGLLWGMLATVPFFVIGPSQPRAVLFLTGAGLVLVLAVVESGYRMAFHDELTGLPGRRALMQTLSELGRRYTLAMVDVDHFKKFNDTHGHDVGDQVLRMVATQLGAVSGGGKAFRYGGEEFTLVFPGRALDEAKPHLEAARLKVQKATFVLRGEDRPPQKPEGGRINTKKAPSKDKKLSVTVSIGAAEATERGTRAEDVLEAADQALYRAKRGGRNRVAG